VPNRTIWIDYAKGMGIILVVHGHVAGGIVTAGIKYDQQIYLTSQSIISSFHMPLFFFLSGLFFFSSLNKRGGGGLFKNKLDTIFYPYVVWCLIDGGIIVTLSNYTNRDTSFSDVLSLLWAPYSHLWFLYALFFVFVVSILAYKSLPERFHYSISLVAILLYLYSNYIPPVIPLNFIAEYLVFFVFGIYFNQIKDSFSRNINVIFLLLLLTFLLIQWFFHFKLGLLINNNRGWLTLLLALVSISLIVSCCMILQRFQLKALEYIGVSSLGIYLMHVLAGSGFRIILQKVFGVYDLSIHLIFGTLAGVTFPLIAMSLLAKANIKYLIKPSLRFKPSTILVYLQNKTFRKNSPGKS
jgi:fucose 4-O-acetylase-like acetyltransferase